MRNIDEVNPSKESNDSEKKVYDVAINQEHKTLELNFVSHFGIPLLPDQSKVLSDLENLIHRKIPFYSDMKHHQIGYSAKNGMIKTLRLVATPLKQLPLSFGNLIGLESLVIGNCGLNNLSKNFGNLQALEALVIFNCKLRTLPATIARLSSLTLLNLSHNLIQEIPKIMVGLKSLEICVINQNSLEEMASSFCDLQKLKYLDLSTNRIRKLPESLDQLINLEEFWLENNLLNELPPEIGRMSRLRKLSLANNKFTQIPWVLKNFELKELYLDENPWESTSSDLLNQTHQNIQQILSDKSHHFLPKLIEKLKQNIPIDELELEYPNLQKYTSYLEPICSKINNESSLTLMQYLHSKESISVKGSDLSLWL